MGFTGAEVKKPIYSDLVNYGVGDTGTGVTKLLVKTSTLWVAAYLQLYDLDNYYFKPVLVSSDDGGDTWTDLLYPNVEGVNHGYIKIAVGTDDTVHVISMDANGMGEFYYVTYSSGAWSSVDTVAATGNVGDYPHMVLDSNDKPHVVLGLFDGGVSYTNKVSGSWLAWELAADTDYRFNNMGIDTNNTLHLNIVNESFNVCYTSGAAGSWAASEVVDAVSSVNYSDITVNGLIPYIIMTTYDLIKVLKKPAGTWVSDDFENSGLSSNRLSTASHGGFVYITYEVSPTPDFDNTQWFYTDNSLGSWAEPVNVTNSDTNNWSAGSFWTDGTSFGLLAMGDFSIVAGWFISAAPPPSENKWGTLALNLYEYQRNDIDQFGEENSLIAYVGVTTAQSRLLMAGRGRERREVMGWAEKADFDSMEVDYEAYTQKIVTFHDGTQINPAIIEELSGDRKKGSTRVWYKAVFLEV